MKIAVRYYTRGGNTKKVADSIAKAVGVEAQEISVPIDGDEDILFLGSSVYGARPDVQVREYVASLGSKNVGIVVNFGTAALIDSTYNAISKIAVKSGVNLAKEEFHCRGEFKSVHQGHPNTGDLDAAANFAKDFVEKHAG